MPDYLTRQTARLWTTRDEMELLREWARDGKTETLLRGYLSGACLRSDWAGMNAGCIMRYCRVLIMAVQMDREIPDVEAA